MLQTNNLVFWHDAFSTEPGARRCGFSPFKKGIAIPLKCLHIHPMKGKSYQIGKAFKCRHCGNHCDADENGSKVISIVGASVNMLGGSVLSCNFADHIRATEIPWLLAVG